jgi:hypothetical protein
MILEQYKNMIIQNFNFDLELIEARSRATIMVQNGLYSRFGYSIEVRIDKALLGCIGEIAFQRFLEQSNIDFELDKGSFATRNSDEFDFLINEKKLDVKVAKKSTKYPPSDNWTYGYPQEQNPITKDFVVVGWVDFINKNVGFYGWTTGEIISKFDVVTKNTFSGYPYNTPNHEFPWGILNKNFTELFQ